MDLFTLMGRIAIESGDANAEMDNMITKAGTLQSTLNGTADAAEGAGEAAEESADQAGKAASKWTIMWGNLATQAANKAYNIGKSFFQTGFEFNQNMEKWTATFKTYMGGNLEAATAFVEKIRQFAIETPLSMSDSVQAATRLLASGIDSSEVLDTLRMLGDIANGDTEKMSRLALVYSQVIAAGKLKGNDPNQFKEAGVPIYDLLLDYYHANGYDYIDEAFMQEMQRKGGITADDVVGALKMATSEGGLYYNAMNNMMDTEYGQAQKMIDNYEQAAGAFTKAIFDVFASDTIPALNEILQQLNEWATENPDALKNLAEAFSALATGGIDVLLGSLQGLLSFWNDNQEMFNAMLILFGGLAIKAGHPAAGMALITAGGYNVWDDWVNENRKEFSGLTSDVDLPFIRQQLEHQGKAGQWEAYLESWKQARRGEGYTDADIDGFLSEQFKNYVPLTDEQMDAMSKGYQWNGPDSYENGGMSALDAFLNRFELWNWGNDNGIGINENGHGGGFRRFGLPDGVDVDGTGGSMGIVGTLTAIQGTLASLPAEVQSAASSGVAEGVGGITITGSITTGDVTLDTGVVVGQLIPHLDLKLGAANARAGRGA